MTQVELAAKLNVTDKAVSKWESGYGNPDISLLQLIAKIFEVSTDYLLTGKEQPKNMLVISKMELCAKTDDVEMAKNFFGKQCTDENDKCLLQYIYQYESTNIFKAFDLRGFLGKNYQIEGYGLDNFLYMTLISNAIDNMKKFSYFSKRNITGILDLRCDYYTDKVIKALFTDKRVQKEIIIVPLNKEIWNPPLDWQLIYSKCLKWILTNGDDNEINRFIEYIEAINNKNLIDYKNRKEKDSGYNSFVLVSSYKDKQKHINYRTFTFPIISIDIKTIEECVKNKKISIARRLNGINKLVNQPTFNEHIIDVEELKNTKGVKEIDVKKASVIIDGLIDIDSLISLDDFGIYKELISNFPASKAEELYFAIQEKNYKKVFDFAIKFDFRDIIIAIREKDLNKVDNAFESIIFQYNGISLGNQQSFIKLIPKESLNSKYFVLRDKKMGLDAFFNQKMCLNLKKIIKNNDIRFYQEAVKQPQGKLDWALETILKEKPNRYDIQDVLLDAGAKLHSSYMKDNGWDYDEIDEIDEVATQLLKNQIKVLSKKEEKYD